MKRLNGGLFQVKLNTKLGIGEEIEITNEEDIKSLREVFESPLRKPILIEFDDENYGNHVTACVPTQFSNSMLEFTTWLSDVKIIFKVSDDEVVYTYQEL